MGLRRLFGVCCFAAFTNALRLLAPESAAAGCNPPHLFEPAVVLLTKYRPNMRSATTVPPDDRYAGTEQPRLPDDTCPAGLSPGINGSGEKVCFDCGSDGFDVETNECVVCPANSFWGYGTCIMNCDPDEFFELEGFQCVENCPPEWRWQNLHCVSPPPSSPPEWQMDLVNDVWRSLPDPQDGYVWDAGLGKWRRCVGDEEWIDSIGLCCAYGSVCENQGRAGEASLVQIPEGVSIRITALTGEVESSDDGGETWQPVQVDDVLTGKLLRVKPGSSANWERNDASSTASFPGAPPGGYFQLLQGSVDIVQLGSCSATAARCGAHADAGTALLREDFSLGEYVALEARIIGLHRLRLSNLAPSGGSVDVWRGSPGAAGPVTSLQPGESVTFKAPPVPMAGRGTLLALSALLAGLGIRQAAASARRRISDRSRR